MEHNSYCIATFRDCLPINTPDGDEFRFVDNVEELPDFSAVVEYLTKIYDHHATRMADRNAEMNDPEDLSSLGGFASRISNRFGGEIEIAIGREYCFLFRWKPEPAKGYCNGPDNHNTLDFYLHGFNHTEMFYSQLVRRDECLKHLRNWLETDAFPENAV